MTIDVAKELEEIDTIFKLPAERCGTCHFADSNATAGSPMAMTCRREPFRVNAVATYVDPADGQQKTTLQSMQPPVPPTGWCGEFKLRQPS